MNYFPKLIFVLSLIMVSQAWAFMSSDNYQIIFDDFNAGGTDNGSSENFFLEDTIGGLAPGLANYDDYQLNAGYRQAYAESFIALSGEGDLSFGDLIDRPLTKFDERSWKVTTNLASYDLLIRANSSPALQRINGDDYFDDYESLSNNIPDYNFIISSDKNLFSYSITGTDIINSHKNNGSICGLGLNSSLNNCWMGFSTNDRLIAHGSNNDPQGEITTIRFRIDLGEEVSLLPGDYQAIIIVTALSL